jgi:hypothetical protein
LEIKNFGRPMPEMVLTKDSISRGKVYMRKVVASALYKEHSWLCGCDVTRAFFCFPCLLYGGSDAWSRRGVSNLPKICAIIYTHEHSKQHKVNMFEFQILGFKNIQAQLSSDYHAKILEKNMKISKNRELLSRLIDCIKSCSVFEFISLRGQKEPTQEEYPRIHSTSPVNLTAVLDSELKSHCDSIPLFMGTSKAIRNELLQCIVLLIRDEIVKEMNKSTYVALVVDDTTDVSSTAKMATVFRYLDCAGNVCERFWGFCKPKEINSDSITDILKKDLNVVLGMKQAKLIAQCFEFASLNREKMNDVQTKIKESYPNAHFIHCQCQELNLVMQRVCAINDKTNAFFANLNTLPMFFLESPDRRVVLDSSVSNASVIQWNSLRKTIDVVYEQQNALYDCFCKLQSTNYNSATLSGASDFIRMLEDREFCNWLYLFYKVMPHVDTFYRCMHEKNIDSDTAINNVDKFVSEIKQIFSEINEGDVEFKEPVMSCKRRKTSITPVQSQKDAALEVCDTIISHVCERFKMTGHLDASALVYPPKFIKYIATFPEEMFHTAIKNFPMLLADKLRIELEVLYSRRELRQSSGAIQLLKFLIKTNMQDLFPQTIKLLEIVCTIPMFTCEADRCSSILTRIRSFLNRSATEDQFTALAMLFIEKDFVSGIKDFNSKIMDMFARQPSRRKDFCYKKP